MRTYSQYFRQSEVGRVGGGCEAHMHAVNAFYRIITKLDIVL